MAEFHVSLSRDAFDRYTRYLVQKMSDPIREFYGIVVDSVREQYEKEHKSAPSSEDSRGMLVDYCREFELLNTEQIGKTVKVMLKKIEDVQSVRSILRVLFRNVAEVLSSVTVGDPSRLNLAVDLPSVDRFMHKWLSLLCRRLVRYPHLVYREGVPAVDQLKYDREWDRLVKETLESTIGVLVGVDDIVKAIERSESEPSVQAVAVPSVPSVPSVAAGPAGPNALSANEEKELEQLVGSDVSDASGSGSDSGSDSEVDDLLRMDRNASNPADRSPRRSSPRRSSPKRLSPRRSPRAPPRVELDERTFDGGREDRSDRHADRKAREALKDRSDRSDRHRRSGHHGRSGRA
jgi:hypothetical protein